MDTAPPYCVFPLTRQQNGESTPLLPLPRGCMQGEFVQREKRFTVHFRHKQQMDAAHCNNSGSMLGLLRKGSPVYISPATKPGRKLLWTVEMLAPYGFWIGVNTSVPNRLLAAAFAAGKLPWAAGYTQCQTEVKRGASRLDAVFTGAGLPPLWVECKNVTLVEDGVALFPDAVTTRGQKHIQEMIDIVRSGERAAFFYCIQRPDAQCFAPADMIDPSYAALFQESAEQGVASYPYTVLLDTQGYSLGEQLPLASYRD